MKNASGLLGRVLAVLGAGAIAWSVTSRAWWSYRGGSSLFEDMTGRLGPYHGTWCSDAFCHDLDMDRAGKGFETVGAATFYVGLLAAAVLVMTALASRARLRSFTSGAIGVSAATAVAALLLVAVRGPIGLEGDATVELGVGLPIALAGVACAIVGCILARRAPVEWAVRSRPIVGNALVVAASVVTIFVVFKGTFWQWSWVDERNEVGLQWTERCWVRADRAICSQAADVLEMFMEEDRDKPRFGFLLTRTFNLGLGAALLAIGILVAPHAARGSPWPARLAESAHMPWILLLLIAVATLAATPDGGDARDYQLGYGFPVLFVACVVGIIGSLLARPPPRGVEPVAGPLDSPP